ncbi:DNA mismatch repair ATPase MutL [Clostridium pascui]|uniref:GDSL-type esterase/lipase family protein n=1 Tax=Clostridium pascui TaxID=46609 RepID=UPI001958C736|nr:GDSL-type esterase/lipase family protein [Clostridium pascui]MBM7870997.1 DNA mismatch repair ATPase MutL [Clostridium pascui]
MKRRKKKFNTKRFAMSLTVIALLSGVLTVSIKKFINKDTQAYTTIQEQNNKEAKDGAKDEKENVQLPSSNAENKDTPSDKSGQPSSSALAAGNVVNTNANSSTNNSSNNTNTTTSNSASSSKEANKAYFNMSMFLGDSITEGMWYYGALDTAHVIAKKGLSVFHATNEVEKLTASNPKDIYILLGNNDLVDKNLTPERFITQYGVLIDSIKSKSPNTRIHVLSILPVTPAAEAKNSAFANSRINTFNAALANLSSEKGADYINARSVVDSNPSLHEQDGIHYKANFYNVLLDYIRQHTLSQGN